MISLYKLNTLGAEPISFQKLWNFGKTFSWHRHIICHVDVTTNPQFGSISPGLLPCRHVRRLSCRHIHRPSCRPMCRFLCRCVHRLSSRHVRCLSSRCRCWVCGAGLLLGGQGSLQPCSVWCSDGPCSAWCLAWPWCWYSLLWRASCPQYIR